MTAAYNRSTLVRLSGPPIGRALADPGIRSNRGGKCRTVTTQPDVDLERLLKLRLVVARIGEMDRASAQ
jgi:hypothetical protein